MVDISKALADSFAQLNAEEGTSITPEVGGEADLSLDDDSTVDADISLDSEEPVDKLAEPADAPEKVEAVKPKELEVPFTDADGVRQVLKYDLSDTAKIAKDLSLAQGARRWQAERDRANASLKKIEPEYKDLRSSWDSLEKAWDGDGVKGITDLLGGQGAFERLIAKEVSKSRVLESGDSDAIEKLQLQERLEKSIREQERTTKKLNESAAQSEKAKTEAQEASDKAMIFPAFASVSFEGKLGDTAAEQSLNEAVWSQALKKLDSLPAGTDINRTLVTKIFKETAAVFGNAVAKQANSKATAILNDKKESAKTRVAADVKERVSSGNIGKSERVQKAVESKDTHAIFKAWFS